MVDPDGSVLLFRGGDPARPEVGSWWFAPGGGVEGDETLEQAAAREVFEETGYQVGDLGPAVHRREADFWFNEVFFHTVETYYKVQVERFEPTADGWTETERSTITEHRWWTAAELRATTDTVYPERLAELLDGDAPAPGLSSAPSTGLLNDLDFKTALPHAPFSELHSKVIDRPIDEVWPACLETTAKEVRTLGPLMTSSTTALC
jgi:8-oxo-dGTP pyrophosphatase MutT (NUDIX family)